MIAFFDGGLGDRVFVGGWGDRVFGGGLGDRVFVGGGAIVFWVSELAITLL